MTPDTTLSDLKNIKSSESRYEYLIKKGRELPAPPHHDEKFIVKGCVSRAWLIPEYKDGKLYFYADSDAAIVKGILAILLLLYNGQTPRAILAIQPEVLREAGVTEHLSMNRRNGLAHFVKQIQLYAATYAALESTQTEKTDKEGT
jgi:cysteine desulfuration protein SufE